MAAPKAPLLGGKAAKEVSLDETVFAAEVKPHLVHEAVRAELNAARQGTRAAKTDSSRVRSFDFLPAESRRGAFGAAT